MYDQSCDQHHMARPVARSVLTIILPSVLGEDIVLLFIPYGMGLADSLM
jgi:hypothetical protein